MRPDSPTRNPPEPASQPTLAQLPAAAALAEFTCKDLPWLILPLEIYPNRFCPAQFTPPDFTPADLTQEKTT